MGTTENRFLRTWILAGIGFVTLFSGFDAIMDPYLLFNVPRIAGFNARKPAVDAKQQRLMKAYDVLRARPKTLILGSSDSAMGLDAGNGAWPEQNRPVYNLGFAWGSPYVAYRYLQHVMSKHKVSLVVMGLDFEYSVGFQNPFGNDFESHLLARRDGSAIAGQSQHFRDLVRSTISLDAMIDSSTELTYNIRGISSDLATGGNWDTVWTQRFISAVGSYSFVTLSDIRYIYWYRDRYESPIGTADLQDLRSILDLCESHQTRVILFMSPLQVDELEILTLTGQWAAFERWKRGLVALIATHPISERRGGVLLWDFTGYDAYSTEPVSRSHRVLRWFVNGDHYTKALGEIIVRRIFGSDDILFGALLNPDNIESHLAKIRATRNQYREQNPAETRRVQDLFDRVMRNSSPEVR